MERPRINMLIKPKVATVATFVKEKVVSGDGTFPLSDLASYQRVCSFMGCVGSNISR